MADGGQVERFVVVSPAENTGLLRNLGVSGVDWDGYTYIQLADRPALRAGLFACSAYASWSDTGW